MLSFHKRTSNNVRLKIELICLCHRRIVVYSVQWIYRQKCICTICYSVCTQTHYFSMVSWKYTFRLQCAGCILLFSFKGFNKGRKEGEERRYIFRRDTNNINPLKKKSAGVSETQHLYMPKKPLNKKGEIIYLIMKTFHNGNQYL